jgi:hypothetical protein
MIIIFLNTLFLNTNICVLNLKYFISFKIYLKCKLCKIRIIFESTVRRREKELSEANHEHHKKNKIFRG